MAEGRRLLHYSKTIFSNIDNYCKLQVFRVLKALKIVEVTTKQHGLNKICFRHMTQHRLGIKRMLSQRVSFESARCQNCYPLEQAVPRWHAAVQARHYASQRTIQNQSHRLLFVPSSFTELSQAYQTPPSHNSLRCARHVFCHAALRCQITGEV